MIRVLRIDASARTSGSVSRALADRAVGVLRTETEIALNRRDLADGVPIIDSDWIEARGLAGEDRMDEQRQALVLSDTLIDELRVADLLLIALPIYNFTVPASFKAWIDLVCRARETFRYTENGPIGLLAGKRALVLFVSGGTAYGSEIDFASGYVRHILGFIGITDVEFIAADRVLADPARMETAERSIDAFVSQLVAAFGQQELTAAQS
ncbi:MAG: NAD(P)H-dependent oxidoreductase [Pseudomonadota bacterium]